MGVSCGRGLWGLVPPCVDFEALPVDFHGDGSVVSKSRAERVEPGVLLLLSGIYYSLWV